MNNLEKAFGNDHKRYEEALAKLINEMKGYLAQLEQQYNNSNYTDLKSISHNIRNIAGALGLTKLKMLSAFWEEVCDEQGRADISEYKKILSAEISSLEKNKS